MSVRCSCRSEASIAEFRGPASGGTAPIQQRLAPDVSNTKAAVQQAPTPFICVGRVRPCDGVRAWLFGVERLSSRACTFGFYSVTTKLACHMVLPRVHCSPSPTARRDRPGRSAGHSRPCHRRGGARCRAARWRVAARPAHRNHRHAGQRPHDVRAATRRQHAAGRVVGGLRRCSAHARAARLGRARRTRRVVGGAAGRAGAWRVVRRRAAAQRRVRPGGARRRAGAAARGGRAPGAAGALERRGLRAARRRWPARGRGGRAAVACAARTGRQWPPVHDTRSRRTARRGRDSHPGGRTPRTPRAGRD